MNAFGMQHLPDSARRRGITHQKGGVDLMLEQGLKCRFPCQIYQLGWTARLDVVSLQQGQSKEPRATPLGANGDTLPFKLRKPVNGPRVSVNDRYRLIKHTSKRYDLINVTASRNTPLHESDINLAFRIGQAPEVFQ